MAKHDYIFVDESGDPGYTLDPDSGELLSSAYYVAAALHLCDDSFDALNKHVAAFRYYSGMNRELKIHSGKEEFTRLLGPIRALADGGRKIWASVVYVDKRLYSGSSLKPGGSKAPNPVRFRNAMLRRLLEHHFERYALQSRQYDLVLDRVTLMRDEVENLRLYISNNRNFPTPTYITHASSIYVEGLQVVHHIANGYKDVVDGGPIPAELSFVNVKDLIVEQEAPGP